MCRFAFPMSSLCGIADQWIQRSVLRNGHKAERADIPHREDIGNAALRLQLNVDRCYGIIQRLEIRRKVIAGPAHLGARWVRWRVHLGGELATDRQTDQQAEGAERGGGSTFHQGISFQTLELTATAANVRAARAGLRGSAT